MELRISKNVLIWQKFNIDELYLNTYFDMDSIDLVYARIIGNPTKICIKEKWFDVIPLHKLFRLKK